MAKERNGGMEKRAEEDLVEATLRSWDEAFDDVSSASKRTRNPPSSGREAGEAGTSVPTVPTVPIYQDPEAFELRLGTFDAATYFAKPLALSPIVCAAFG